MTASEPTRPEAADGEGASAVVPPNSAAAAESGGTSPAGAASASTSLSAVASAEPESAGADGAFSIGEVPAPGVNWDVDPIVVPLDVAPPNTSLSPAEATAGAPLTDPTVSASRDSLAADNHVDEAVAMVNPLSSEATAPSVPESSARGPGPLGQNSFRLPGPGSTNENLTLKNAKVGIECDYIISTDGLKELRITQPVSEMGLHFDRATSSLRGIPHLAGDFEWVITALRDQAPVNITVRLAVIPDPRTLWKDLPSDPGAPFRKLDQNQDSLNGEVYIVAASKRGRSHAHDGLFRDDDFAFTTFGPGGWHIVTVADGAGSAKYSREGSRIAVDHVVRNLPGAMTTKVNPRLDEMFAMHAADPQGCSHAIRTVLYEALVSVAFAAAKDVESSARQAGHEPGDYSTTLIMAAVAKTARGWFIASFSIGDGGAALLDLPAGTVTVMTTPDGGEFAGQTRFLRTSEFSDSSKSIERIHFAIRPSFTALALMTDGISDPMFPTEVTFADFGQWKEFWESNLTPAVNVSRDNPHVGEELLAWMDFWSDGNHDDRTLAVLLP